MPTDSGGMRVPTNGGSVVTDGRCARRFLESKNEMRTYSVNQKKNAVLCLFHRAMRPQALADIHFTDTKHSSTQPVHGFVPSPDCSTLPVCQPFSLSILLDLSRPKHWLHSLPVPRWLYTQRRSHCHHPRAIPLPYLDVRFPCPCPPCAPPRPLPNPSCAIKFSPCQPSAPCAAAPKQHIPSLAKASPI